LLADIIKRTIEAEGKEAAAVLTFNYDVAADLALVQRGMSPEYRLSDLRRPGDAVDLLKLHGSTNWYGGSNGEIHFTPVGQILRNADMSRGVSDVALPLSKLASGAIIVPPSWSKLHQYNRIERVWRAAAAHLGTAENIYVLGYSLPPSDNFFRLLYALGTAGDTRLRRFWVFDPNRDIVEKRFRDLLGQSAEDRFAFRPWKFGEALNELNRAWKTGSLPIASAQESAAQRK
jgi:hypothetical protein